MLATHIFVVYSYCFGVLLVLYLQKANLLEFFVYAIYSK